MSYSAQDQRLFDAIKEDISGLDDTLFQAIKSTTNITSVAEYCACRLLSLTNTAGGIHTVTSGGNTYYFKNKDIFA